MEVHTDNMKNKYIYIFNKKSRFSSGKKHFVEIIITFKMFWKITPFVEDSWPCGPVFKIYLIIL